MTTTFEVVPCVALDIFSGSGTLSVAAKHLGRRSIGIELNHKYAALGRHRVARDIPRWARPTKPAAMRRPRRSQTTEPTQLELGEAVAG